MANFALRFFSILCKICPGYEYHMVKLLLLQFSDANMTLNITV